MAVGKDEKMNHGDDIQEKKAVNGDDDDMETPIYKTGDRVTALWQGNGCYYPATVEEVNFDKKTLKVVWDDKDDSHRDLSFDQVQQEDEDELVNPFGWTMPKIEKTTYVKDSDTKGRCLFTKKAVDPGGIVFAEAPTLVALPGENQKLWDHMSKLHQKQPLQLGTISFYYAAILTHLTRDDEKIRIVADKFVPDPDEPAGEDVLRIVADLKENLSEHLELKKYPIDPKYLQKLVSAWRYNSFGHHKEDGLVLYNRISMCAHSCDPNCCWSYGQEDSFVLRARVHLEADAELMISYLQDEDLLKGTNIRRAKLQNWKFTCGCSRCEQKVDLARGFQCRQCRLGVCYYSDGDVLTACHVCGKHAKKEDTTMLITLEGQYVQRVDCLDKTDLADVQVVLKAAVEIFENHWMIYVMDTMLWEGTNRNKGEKADEKKAAKAIELKEGVRHQQRRIAFHLHCYPRPTFIIAWAHEELADSMTDLGIPDRWRLLDYQKAYFMLVILCGKSHQYTQSPFYKWQASLTSEIKEEKEATPEAARA